jgi:CHASE3 domain sensor protein
MDSARVVEVLSPMGDKKPETERQTRPLARLEPDKQREVWQKAVETAPEGKVTADHVYKIAKQETQEAEKEVVTSQARVAQTATEAMQFVVIAISQLGRIRKDDPKRVEALNRVKTWINDQLKER